jgi:hypothetical protein
MARWASIFQAVGKLNNGFIFPGELRAHAQRNNVRHHTSHLCHFGELPDGRWHYGASRLEAVHASPIHRTHSLCQAGPHRSAEEGAEEEMRDIKNDGIMFVIDASMLYPTKVVGLLLFLL